MKHTVLFHRAIARIRAINQKDGAVYIDRLKNKLKIDYLSASKLKDELVQAGVLRSWNENDYKGQGSGNILWQNLGKFRVPKTITLEETKRLQEENKKGIF